VKQKLRHVLLGAAVIALPVAAMPAFAQAAGLRAGAARMDITPPLADLPTWFKKINDPIHVRAAVLDDGTSRAVIVVADVPTIATDVSADVRRRIAAEVKAPLANVFFAVTHTHNAVRLDNTVVGVYLPGSPKIVAATVATTLETVKKAVANMQPARAGYAEGSTPLIGRRSNPASNETETFDRTLGVFKVETLDGQPIAMLINSGLEPLVAQAVEGEISGDVAGVAERYVEQRYGDKAVVMYTVGSIGNSFYNARPMPNTPAADYRAVMNAVGSLIGEDALAVAAQIRPSTDVKISGVERVLQCPGKATSPLNNARSCSDAPGAKLPACVFKDTDTAPVQLQMGLLKIGDLKLVLADANVTPPVWQKAKSASPPNTALVALAYGPMHYVMADAVYPSNSYQVTATTAKRGCAEQGFVDNVQAMLKEAR
jgi:neutral ceramidase